jgi:hypothetical protein
MSNDDDSATEYRVILTLCTLGLAICDELRALRQAPPLYDTWKAAVSAGSMVANEIMEYGE